MRRWIRWKLIAWLYPAYDCEDCVGAGREHGCWCDYHGAIAPGVNPDRWRVMLRRLMPRGW